MTILPFPSGQCSGLSIKLAQHDWEGLTHAIQGGVSPALRIDGLPLWHQILKRVPMAPFYEPRLSHDERDKHARVQRLLRAVVARLDAEDQQAALIETLPAGRTDFAQWLIEAGAKPQALRLACAMEGEIGDVQLALFGYDARAATLNFFIANGTDPDAAGSGEPTALMRAILEGKTRWAHALLVAGADPNLPSVSGGAIQLPLEAAIVHQQPDCVAALLLAGAYTRAHGMMAELAQWSIGEIGAARGTPDMLNLLMAYHGRSDLTKWLRAALQNGQVENALWCFDAGADPHAPDHKGRTCAYYAALGGREVLVWHLIQQGVALDQVAVEFLKAHHPETYNSLRLTIEGGNVIEMSQRRAGKS